MIHELEYMAKHEDMYIFFISRLIFFYIPQNLNTNNLYQFFKTTEILCEFTSFKCWF